MSPLEIPLEVRKEMEIAWRQVRAVGRMGENLKLQRLQSINNLKIFESKIHVFSSKIFILQPIFRLTWIRNFPGYFVNMTVFHFTRNNVSHERQIIKINPLRSHFGGLWVACWPLAPKFAGSNPAEAVGFLRAKKSSARLPSEGKVKPSVPRRRFTACKRTLECIVEVDF
jgi:hypothetical protein